MCKLHQPPLARIWSVVTAPMLFRCCYVPWMAIDSVATMFRIFFGMIGFAYIGWVVNATGAHQKVAVVDSITLVWLGVFVLIEYVILLFTLSYEFWRALDTQWCRRYDWYTRLSSSVTNPDTEGQLSSTSNMRCSNPILSMVYRNVHVVNDITLLGECIAGTTGMFLTIYTGDFVVLPLPFFSAIASLLVLSYRMTASLPGSVIRGRGP